MVHYPLCLPPASSNKMLTHCVQSITLNESGSHLAFMHGFFSFAKEPIHYSTKMNYSPYVWPIKTHKLVLHLLHGVINPQPPTCSFSVRLVNQMHCSCLHALELVKRCHWFGKTWDKDKVYSLRATGLTSRYLTLNTHTAQTRTIGLLPFQKRNKINFQAMWVHVFLMRYVICVLSDSVLPTVVCVGGFFSKNDHTTALSGNLQGSTQGEASRMVIFPEHTVPSCKTFSHVGPSSKFHVKGWCLNLL